MKPTLDSRQLHAFSALARRGSFTLAAKDLFLTQSAVSQQIRTLETRYGRKLVERSYHRVSNRAGVAPTPGGVLRIAVVHTAMGTHPDSAPAV